MRIVSLLPSATEIAYALDLGDQLVGVTHECNWPPDARKKTRVSRSLLPTGAAAAEIDRLVTAAANGGAPTEALDEAVLGELGPDVILTQDLCAVCAVPAGDVDAALDAIGCTAQVVSLDPNSIEDILDGIMTVGRATGAESRAATVVADLRRRLDTVRSNVAHQPRRRVLALEWGDPPFNAGHWIPDMIDAAGGLAVLANAGRDSVRMSWTQVRDANADVVVFAPCGYGLDDAVSEGHSLMTRPELSGREVWAVDADSYFVRPGPRIVDGVEILAQMLHPEIGTGSLDGTAHRLQ